jgi:hypothetical protein
VFEATALAEFGGLISLTVAANLLLKLGAGASAAERVLFGLLGWKSMAGLALFGCGGMLYAVLLRQVPLNVAQVFAAAQFVGVGVAAASFWASRSRQRAGSASAVFASALFSWG